MSIYHCIHRNCKGYIVITPYAIIYELLAARYLASLYTFNNGYDGHRGAAVAATLVVE